MKNKYDNYVTCIVVTNRNGMTETIPLNSLLYEEDYQEIQKLIVMKLDQTFGENGADRETIEDYLKTNFKN